MNRIVLAAVLSLGLMSCSREQPAAQASAAPGNATPAAASPSRVPASSGPAARESRYTALDGCKLVESNEEEDWSTSRCEAPGGFTLILDYGDARDELRVGASGAEPVGLNLIMLGGGGFNTLGPNIEWRGTVIKGAFTPTAMIVRNRIIENPENPETYTSMLAVADLTRTCVVAMVRPGPGQNEQAREIADTPGRACMKTGN